jgi:hypothetical protein
VKYWASEHLAVSGHCFGRLTHRSESIDFTSFGSQVQTTYLGIGIQGEYHWRHLVSSLPREISPYLGIGITGTIANYSNSYMFVGSQNLVDRSWYIIGSAVIGAEIFVFPTISLALEQGADIAYENGRRDVFVEPFASVLTFFKAGNSRLLLHLYF